MGLPKFVPSQAPAERNHPRRQDRAIPEDRLTKIFEGDLMARAAGLKLSETELGSDGNMLLARIDLKLDFTHIQGLADLIQTGNTPVTEPLITVLNARGLVVLAQCLNHLLRNADGNSVYLVKKHYNGDDSDSRSFDTLYVGVGV